MNYPIATPIHRAAIYREGVLVRISRPEKFTIHKLIVSDLRRDGPQSPKARKDLMQSEVSIAVLADDRPSNLAEAYREARAKGPRLRTHLQNALNRSSNQRRLLIG